jgi:hypothetical protein
MSLDSQIVMPPLPYEVPQFPRILFHSHGSCKFQYSEQITNHRTAQDVCSQPNETCFIYTLV